MTRTTQALKRLGVAAIAVATIGAGVPALVATGASASNATNTGVTITPTVETNVVNDCNPFTVNVTPADTTTVDIQISQTVATGTATIAFCNPQSDQGPGSQAGPNGHTTTTDNAGFVRPNTGPTPATQCAPPNSGTTVTCDAEYTTNSAGALTFGVISNSTGTLNLTAFVETNNPVATPGFGTYNTTGNNVPDGSEKQATATKNLVTNANNAVTSLSCTPPAENLKTSAVATFTCTAFSTVGANSKVPTRGVTVSNIINSGPDKSTNLTQNDPAITCGQPTTATPPTVNTGTTAGTKTNNQATVFCSFQNNGQPGTDNVVNYVEQNGTAGPQSTEPNTSVTRTFAGAARYINCTPQAPTVRYGIDQAVNCTVTDLNGNPVPNVSVDFQASFPGGRFTDNASNQTVKTTNASGVVTVVINNPDQTSTQSQTVTATISGAFSGFGNQGTATAGAECQQKAGATTQPGQATTATTPTAGKCSDVVTITYTNASASPSATPTATVSPGTCPSPQSNLPFRVNTPTINATGLASVTITGAPANATIEVQGYSQNHYLTANFNNDPTPIDRRVTAGSDGSVTINDLRPASNTRLRARVAGCTFTGQGSVINVRTQLTLAASRTGVRTYVLSGKSTPARPGGLIVGVYRNGVLIPGGQVRASSTTGNYSIKLTFPKSDQNQRINITVRTGQDAQNAPGVSNVRSLLIF